MSAREAAAAFETPVDPPSSLFPIEERSVSSELVRLLLDLGVRQAFGVVGGPIAGFVDVLGRSSLESFHFHHEVGAAFAATEASIASGRPVLVFVTTGPGLLNALNGLAAARQEGAKVIVVSAVTAPGQRGRFASQETSAFSLPYDGLFTSGPLFHHATVLDSAEQLAQTAAALQRGVLQANGFVAHLALSMNVQRQSLDRPMRLPRVRAGEPTPTSAEMELAVERLRAGRFVLWLGFGARHAARAIREFAERTNTPVMCTPRAKGTFPENHPLYLGVTGVGGREHLRQSLARIAPHTLLVLGSRLGEGSSYWHSAFERPGGFVHVDVDSSVFGAAYPEAMTLGLQSEIGAFMSGLAAHERTLVQDGALPPPESRAVLAPRAGSVRPSFLLQQMQRIIVEQSDALLMAEAGSAFVWANQCLRFDAPGRYRVSSGHSSMGHFATGVVGTALATGRRSVALVGDAALLMNNEINAAAQYGANATWIVLNDGRHGVVVQGMRAEGYGFEGLVFPRVDFATLARALGARSLRVESERELDAALRTSVSGTGAWLVDVSIDTEEALPVFDRVANLRKQRAKSATKGAP